MSDLMAVSLLCRCSLIHLHRAQRLYQACLCYCGYSANTPFREDNSGHWIEEICLSNTGQKMLSPVKLLLTASSCSLRRSEHRRGSGPAQRQQGREGLLRSSAAQFSTTQYISCARFQNRSMSRTACCYLSCRRNAHQKGVFQKGIWLIRRTTTTEKLYFP